MAGATGHPRAASGTRRVAASHTVWNGTRTDDREHPRARSTQYDASSTTLCTADAMTESFSSLFPCKQGGSPSASGEMATTNMSSLRHTLRGLPDECAPHSAATNEGEGVGDRVTSTPPPPLPLLSTRRICPPATQKTPECLWAVVPLCSG